MREQKFTPGPWCIKTHESRFMPGTIIQDGICGPDGEQIRVCGMTLTSSDEAEANARLIAAAPELLEAVEAMLEWDAREEDQAVGFYERLGLCAAAFDKARAAHAKATGA